MRHSFTAPNSGTPQSVAPDGTAVTGAVPAKTADGSGDIPEIDLKATRTATKHGLLARTGEILRLDTVGGVAPAGTCTPGAVVGVPYRADCKFVQHRADTARDPRRHIACQEAPSPHDPYGSGKAPSPFCHTAGVRRVGSVV
ncbi:DUF3455 domain-containing protein [Streptomyces sp. NPDC048281]|uniref:DUF3455 domain-containing protein n=1 Tax=Streptomyces sp. NPDC048281 TaxID=3154715 RepID=UPI0034167282